ncbi:MAG: hypothetical protein ROO76_01155 [Terriglobia bacterium]|jgi:hypothetical protein|nr:hypothetical protein [Terriglobia bacterium]
MRERLGWLLLTVGFLIVVVVLGLPQSLSAAPPTGPQVRLDTSKAGPREVEDETKASVTRDYGEAWQALEQALEDNQPDLLTSDFAGYAQNQWVETIKAQKAAGLSRRIVDHGHHLQVIFYSPDGSAMQLRDTAQFEIQYRDGGKILHSENLSVQYLVLMTPAENSWKVRVLQEIPTGAATAQTAKAVFPGAVGGSK